MSERFAELRSLLEDASDGLAEVTQRRMFGCDAFFAAGNIYGLIWKTGRIGLKLPDAQLYADLMSQDGADPWTAGMKTMADWILVPERFHRDPGVLRHWTEQAHRLALVAAATPSSPRRKTASRRRRADGQ